MGRILAKKGDFANVRKQYEVMTALLADELGLEPSDETDKVFNNLKRFGQAESISQSSTAPHFVGTKILEAAPSFDLEILGPLEHFIK
jgi:DNA-binding SARP family transcriptional activator